MAEHLCRDCGLMGQRGDNELLVEAYPRFRDTARSAGRGRSSIVPVCLMGIRNFREDFEKAERTYSAASQDPAIRELARSAGVAARNPDADRLLAINDVLNDPQDCDEWTPYIEGQTPKEHRDLLDRAAALARQQEWQTAESAARTEQLKIARAAAVATEEAARANREAATAARRTAVIQAISVLVAVAAILVGVTVSVTSDDSPDINIQPVIVATPAAASGDSVQP